jgi:hypothetical protein
MGEVPPVISAASALGSAAIRPMVLVVSRYRATSKRPKIKTPVLMSLCVHGIAGRNHDWTHSIHNLACSRQMCTPRAAVPPPKPGFVWRFSEPS